MSVFDDKMSRKNVLLKAIPGFFEIEELKPIDGKHIAYGICAVLV